MIYSHPKKKIEGGHLLQVQLTSIKMPLQYTPILIRFFLWIIGSLSLLVSVFSFSTAEAPGNYLTHRCPNTTIFTPNSFFQSNRNQLLSILVSNATNNSSFYKASAGGQISTETVYGLFICRGDVPTSLCKNCVDAATSKVIQLCPIEKQVLIWYDYCMVRYSNQSFFSTAEQSPEIFMANATEVENGTQFNQVLVSTMDGLVPKVIIAAKKFATQEANITGLKITLYTLGQCTQDLSNGDCITCLTEAKAQLPGCCRGKAGGRVMYPSCNIRFELYPFYSVQESTTEALAPPPAPALKGKSKFSSKVIASILAPVVFSVLVILVVASCFFRRSRLRRAKRGMNKDDEVSQHVLLHDLVIPNGVTITEEGELVCSEELPFIDLATIKIATDDFSESNKLGQGGFGTVYKGLLPDGREVAVKRLSRKSSQGLDEFKNEVILIAKLQHRNLVRLLACGFGGEEKLLLYEFMPNKSLDTFIYDSQRRAEFSWETYYSIIKGIARGLLYLHEDSRLRIIHRDLKPSNVLLDHEMVAKISDFGMARIFCENQNTANTKRVVGTYGYMAPEYAMEGLFSVKSDVFSFGVIILEIISGKRNGGFFLTEHAKTLLAYAWKLWKDGKELEFVEPRLMESCPTTQILRCLHIALLCVQEDPEERSQKNQQYLQQVELPQLMSVALLRTGSLFRSFCQGEVNSLCLLSMYKDYNLLSSNVEVGDDEFTPLAHYVQRLQIGDGQYICM